VRLFHRVPLSEVQRVRLDASSRTSAVLARIVLEDRHGVSPHYETLATAPGDLRGMQEDAALLIGDPALVAMREGALPSVDLADEWIALTGKPFVFAAWVVRRSLARERGIELANALRDAARAGGQSIDDLAGEFSAAHPCYGFERAFLARYLRENICHEMGPRELEGLAEYARRAHARGLCESRGIELIE
jgi:chorismate dehydratase